MSSGVATRSKTTRTPVVRGSWGNETHPFRDEQVMALAVSTSGYDEAIPIEDRHWIDGGTPRQSYVLPWSVHSPQDRHIEFRQGTLVDPLVNRAIAELRGYVE